MEIEKFKCFCIFMQDFRIFRSAISLKVINFCFVILLPFHVMIYQVTFYWNVTFSVIFCLNNQAQLAVSLHEEVCVDFNVFISLLLSFSHSLFFYPSYIFMGVFVLVCSQNWLYYSAVMMLNCTQKNGNLLIKSQYMYRW